MGKTISYSTDARTMLLKLERAVKRLGAEDFDYDHSSSRNDSAAWVTFKYKGNAYRFEYSRSKAAYFGIKVAQDKDILGALSFAITDLARLAERGIFDFGQLIQGFKELPLINMPGWATFMGFKTMPRNFQEVNRRYKELVLGAMSPETNSADFKSLNDHLTVAKKFFGVEA